MKEQVERVLAYSQKLPIPLKIDRLLAEWEKNKADFRNALNGELIYEYPEPVTFTLSDEAKITRVVEFAESISRIFGLSALADFLYANQDSFFDNKVTATLSSTPKEIQDGSKIIKDFKYFINDETLCRRLQDQASQLIQEDKVTGKLCISIHPLDYLSVSENNYNWRSCHALNGEYRAGNLSYMTDNCTVICYLKGEDEAELPNFPKDIKWNSKKWRVLLFFSEDWSTIYAGRQYPFASDNALELVRKHLITRHGLQLRNIYTDWDNTYVTRVEGNQLADRYAMIRDRLYGIRTMIHHGADSQQFNDLLSSSCYTKPYYLWSWKTPLKHYNLVESKLAPKFRIGGETKCICCGENNVFASDTMICDDCYHKVPQIRMCACCGREITGWIKDEWDASAYCLDCASERLTECPSCGRTLAITYLIDGLCPACYE